MNTPIKVCAALAECDRAATRRGYCDTHYRQMINGREVTPITHAADFDKCSALDDCFRAPRSKQGYCPSHYKQWKKGIQFTELRRYRPAEIIWDGSGTKQCGNCLRRLPPESFSMHNATRDGLHWECKECRYNTQAIQKYGIPAPPVDALCEICGGNNPSRKRLGIDHDHACCAGEWTCGSCLRGILCGRCNLNLAAVEDSERLAKALAYVRKYQEAK